MNVPTPKDTQVAYQRAVEREGYAGDSMNAWAFGMAGQAILHRPSAQKAVRRSLKIQHALFPSNKKGRRALAQMLEPGTLVPTYEAVLKNGVYRVQAARVPRRWYHWFTSVRSQDQVQLTIASISADEAYDVRACFIEHADGSLGRLVKAEWLRARRSR